MSARLNAPNQSLITHTSPPTNETESLIAAAAVAYTDRPTDTLDADQRTVRDDLLGTEPTDAEMARAERVAPTTTGTLIALAAFLASVDDDAGAALLRRFAVEYATHEATVI